MNDDYSVGDGEYAVQKPGHVWITRRRLDAYFLPAALVVTVSGALEFWFSSRTIIFAGLVPFAVFWAVARWGCARRGGSAVPTLSAIPGMIPFLWWLFTWGLLIGVGGVTLLNVILPLPEKGQSWNARAAIIWVGFMICWFAGLLIGVARLERTYARKPSASDDRLLE
jgi:hypothetical protein